MPIEGLPDPQAHRLCRRCGKWFEPRDGSLMTPEVTGPLGALHAARASFDASLVRFQCHRCTRTRRTTRAIIWGTFLSLVTIILVLEKLGLMR
jgi:hypothetical protein